MHGLTVSSGEMAFLPEYTLEWAVLARGAKGARKRIRKMRKKLSPNDRRASEMMDAIPVVVPTSREETYERAYALIREAGRGMGEELRRMEFPPGEKGLLKAAFMEGFLAAGLGAESKRWQYIGIARLFHDCGGLVANMLISVFPEKEGEPEPDVDEPFDAFWRGVADEAGGGRDD